MGVDVSVAAYYQTGHTTQWRIQDLKKRGAPGDLGACPQDFLVC